MQNRGFKNYELLDISEKPITEHTHLYSLEPIGLGTVLIESLTGYINRLAINHNITVYDLLTKIVAQEGLGYKVLSPSIIQSIYRVAFSLNGFSEKSFMFVSALNKLTGRNDLTKLTLNNWKNLVPNKKLFKYRKCFCPVCYQSRRKGSLELYEPLLFSVSSVNICPIHNIKLSDTCLYDDCQKPQLFLASHSVPGYCQYCNRWLGRDLIESDFNNDKREIKKEDWVIKQIGSLLNYNENLYNNSSAENVKKTINIIKSDLAGSFYELSKATNLPYNTIKRWSTGESKPNIENLIKVCNVYGISPNTIVTLGKIEKIDSTEDKTIERRNYRNRKKHIDKDELQDRLKGYLYNFDEEPLPLTTISIRVQISMPTLRKLFPDLCKEIVSKRKKYVSDQAIKKQNELIEFVKSTIIRFHSLGEYPSAGLVMHCLPNPAWFRRKEVYAAWEETLIALGIEKAKRGKPS